MQSAAVETIKNTRDTNDDFRKFAHAQSNYAQRLIKEKGNFIGALIYFKSAILSLKQIPSRDFSIQDWTDLTHYQFSIAQVYVDVSNLPNAEHYYKFAIESCKQILTRSFSSKNCRLLADLQSSTAELCIQQGKKEKSIIYYLDVINSLKRIPESEFSSTDYYSLAMHFSHAGKFYYADGNMKDAESYFRNAIRNYSKISEGQYDNASRWELIRNLNDLTAQSCIHQKKYESAAIYLAASITISERLMQINFSAKDCRHAAETHHKFAKTFHSMNENNHPAYYQDCLNSVDKAIMNLKKIPNTEFLQKDWHSLMVMQCFAGDVAYEKDEWKDAEKYYEDGFESIKKGELLISGGQWIAEVYMKAGYSCFHLQKVEKGELYVRRSIIYFEEVIKISKTADTKFLNVHWFNLANAQRILAEILSYQEKFEEAERYSKAALDSYTQVPAKDFDDDHWLNLSDAHSFLAHCYRKKGMYKEAKEQLFFMLDLCCLEAFPFTIKLIQDCYKTLMELVPNKSLDYLLYKMANVFFWNLINFTDFKNEYLVLHSALSELHYAPNLTIFRGFLQFMQLVKTKINEPDFPSKIQKDLSAEQNLKQFKLKMKEIKEMCNRSTLLESLVNDPSFYHGVALALKNLKEKVEVLVNENKQLKEEIRQLKTAAPAVVPIGQRQTAVRLFDEAPSSTGAADPNHTTAGVEKKTFKF